MEKRTDRRVRKTKAQLRAGLASLMKEKNVNDITVKELVEAVDINRSTFYLHYTDIRNMLESVEHEMLEEIENLIYVAQNCKLQVGDLLYSGILIASLGAVMDVAMSISSTIQEIHDRNPEISKKELFKSGIHVGKDMMGTMSNTLILAFTGSSLNTMIMIYAYSYPYNQMINMYSIGIELLRGISGTIGIILAVPFVSLIGSLYLKPNK